MANPFPPAVPGVEPPLVGGNAPGDPIATALPLTYRELYADATKNPNPDRTARYLAGYSSTASQMLQPWGVYADSLTRPNNRS